MKRVATWFAFALAFALTLWAAPLLRAQSPLPKACRPETLTGADTAYRYAVCRSLDVLPVGMRVRLACVDSLMVHGGWAKPLVAETYRSAYRQQYLYQQGRTRPGARVTNVRDARTGFHYWGWAVDLIHPTRYWDHPRYFVWLARHAESCGLVAGGHWQRFQDWPHVQWATIESMSQAPAWAQRLMAEGKRDSLWLLAGATR